MNAETDGRATKRPPSHTTRIALAMLIPAALMVLAMAVTLFVLVRNRDGGPHAIPADQRPAWVNPNGTVNAALAPKELPVVGPDGRAVCNADGSQVMVPLGPQASTATPSDDPPSSTPVPSGDGNVQIVRPYDAATTHPCDVPLTATP
jgi:hypothetical protein